MATIQDLGKLLSKPALCEKKANQIRLAKDINLPTLEIWNYSPCLAHELWQDDEGTVYQDKPKPGCKDCGLVPRKHQRVGATWLYLRKKGLLADQVGTGKAQPLDAKVLTPTGYVDMRSLQIGDQVIDPEGQASVVSGIHPRGTMDVYKITFSDGTSCESTLDHLWKVRPSVSKYTTRVEKKEVTTEQAAESRWRVQPLSEIKEWMDSPHRKHEDGTQKKKMGVPLAQTAANFDGPGIGDLYLHPYLLGCLIGDGSMSTRNSVGITSMDQEIIDAFHSLLPSEVCLKFNDKKSKASTYRIRKADSYNSKNNPLIDELRRLQLQGSLSHEKFIPKEYLLASKEVRLAVLQGLMDTDGEWGRHSHIFGSSSRQLVEDTVFLANSLGLQTQKISTKKTFYKDNAGKRVPCRDFYRVSIHAGDLSIFRLTRKNKPHEYGRRKENSHPKTDRHSNRRQSIKWIESIEYSRTTEVQCISVSAPSHLYVTDGYTVTHNTLTIALTIAMMYENREMVRRPVILVSRAPAILQHTQELSRMLPALTIRAVQGPLKKRRQIYSSRFDIIVMSSQMMTRDIDYLNNFEFSAVFADDVDALRNRSTRTARSWRELTARVPRTYVVSATPLQKRLPELYGALEQVGGKEALGSEWSFKQRYLQMKPVTILARGGQRRRIQQFGAVKNFDELKTKVGPMILRRTSDDIDDIEMPDTIVDDVMLELYKPQRDKYEELQQGILKIVKDGTVAQVKHAEAMTKFLYGAQICGGLAAIGEEDGPNTSVKLDWVMEQLTGDFVTDKVVVFTQYKNNLRALAARLDNAGIGYGIIWGEDRNPQSRLETQNRFWQDPNCRVLLGTTAIEQSLNLQVARRLINVDMIMNAKRMEQLAGRINRAGSAHRTIYIHNLLTIDTQEERYLPTLEREAALSDSLFGTQNQLFSPLSAEQLLALIQP